MTSPTRAENRRDPRGSTPREVDLRYWLIPPAVVLAAFVAADVTEMAGARAQTPVAVVAPDDASTAPAAEPRTTVTGSQGRVPAYGDGVANDAAATDTDQYAVAGSSLANPDTPTPVAVAPAVADDWNESGDRAPTF